MTESNMLDSATFRHSFWFLPDVPGCRCYGQHCAARQSAPPRHPHPPPALPPRSHPACRPFWSPPPARTQPVKQHQLKAQRRTRTRDMHTSSLGLMLYRILSAVSLSWRLSIIARRSLEALFCQRKHKGVTFFEWFIVKSMCGAHIQYESAITLRKSCSLYARQVAVSLMMSHKQDWLSHSGAHLFVFIQCKSRYLPLTLINLRLYKYRAA